MAANSTANSNALQPGESVVYALAEVQGKWFKKRTVRELQITTNRIMIINYESPADSFSLDLQYIDEAIVFDQRKSSSQGFQMSGVRGSFSYYAGQSRSTSNNTGSVYLISYKYSDLRIDSVNDPQSLCKLILGLVRQRKAILEESK